MKGLAPADTLTGKVQRALTDEWQVQAQIAVTCGRLTSSEKRNLRHVLVRLSLESRAEERFVSLPGHLHGGYYEYRKPQ